MRTIFIHELWRIANERASLRASEVVSKVSVVLHRGNASCGLDSSSVSFGDWLTVFMLIEKFPPWMTAPLNKAIDCCDSEVDGEIAGLAFSYEDVLLAAPVSFLVPKKVCKSFTPRCVFCNGALFSCSAIKLNWTDVHKPFRHLENKNAACQFSRQGWRGLPYDHFSLVKNIVRPIRGRERWFFTSEISSFASMIGCD